MYLYSLIIPILTLTVVSDGSVTVCLPLDKLENDGQSDDYSALITPLKEELTSMLQVSNISLDHEDFDIVHPVISAKGAVDNVTVKNIDNYDLKFFTGLLAKKLELFNLTFHNISVVGDYDMYGNIGDLFDVFGEGNLRLNIYNFSISALADLPSINSTSMCLNMDVNVELQALEGWFDNLMNDVELEDLMNRAIMDIASEAVEVIWAEFNDAADGPLQGWVDAVINGTSLHILSKEVREQKIHLNDGQP